MSDGLRFQWLERLIGRAGSGRAMLVIVTSAVALFLLIAFLRVVPENHRSSELAAIAGPIERSVDNVFRKAAETAGPPFLEAKGHLLFFGRNPGLFKFVAEMAIRMGAESPFPLQLFTIFMNALGLVFLALWVAVLFRDERSAAAAMVFMLATSMLLRDSTSIHSGPYVFVFLNATVFSFLIWIRTGQSNRRWLWFAALSYFMCCMNYWFYYLSLGLFLVVLAHHENVRLARKQWALLAAAPASALLITFFSAISAAGGFEAGLFKLGEILVARTVDARLPGSEWYPDRKFLGVADVIRYPFTVQQRIKGYFLFGWIEFGLLLGLAKRVFGDAKTARFLLLSMLAAMSWYFVMIQHVKIHVGTGAYSWFGFMLIFVYASKEAWSRSSLRRPIRLWRGPELVLSLVIGFVGYGLFNNYLVPAQKMIQNLVE